MGSFLLVVRFLLTVELLCLQSVEVLSRRTFPLRARKLELLSKTQTVSERISLQKKFQNTTLSEEAYLKPPTVSKKAASLQL